MAWQTYGLDREAQKLVLAAKKRDADSLNQSFKMRMTAAYGLERFWGEQLRLRGKEQSKADYWKETWDSLVKIMDKAGIKLPNHSDIEITSQQLWGDIPIVEGDASTKLSLNDQRIALAVLTQFCDCLVWWTQRYK
ncbi:MAG: hypothetical protein HC852_13470 [Acaryochloridaceae cyanobacterium RU_4_10]|nr:hypothetical protein [Acaryochloridaceae cyanobacterium RU_4_10]